MSESKHQESPLGAGIKVGRLFGITVVLDWSLLFIASLIAATVALGPLSTWHPDWPAWMLWLLGACAAVLLFASILVHELSHALMARHYGSQVERITLFIFGGMAHIEEEAKHWREELWVAIVGPITSIVLGILFLTLAGFFIGPAAETIQSPEELFRQLGPVATLLFWVGNINIILALFNLVPAFPLDGGRVLRAVIWGATGDAQKASRIAGAGGRLFAWLLIATGLAMILGMQVPIFGTGLVGGLWLCFIGWFLYRTALASSQQSSLRTSLGQVGVERLMRRDFNTVAPIITIQELVDSYLLNHSQRGFPVVQHDDMVGVISIEDIRRVNRTEWPNTSVQSLMTPREKLVTVAANDDCFTALTLLSKHNVNQLPVLDGNRLIGLLQREDILRWLQIYAPEQSGTD